MSELQFSEKLLQTGIVSFGAAGALEKFRSGIRSKKPVVYAAIGGSITQGGRASCPGNCYVSRIGAAIAERTSCRVVNAGVGATDSGYGVFRADADLLSCAPDLITIEFAVNDFDKPEAEATYEALIRKCLKSAPQALILLLFAVYQDGRTVEEKQTAIGRHYGLPMLSPGKIMNRGMAKKLFRWEDIAADHVHPNDAGHRLFAEAAEYLLLKAPVPETTCGAVTALPSPLHPDTAEYERGRIVRTRQFQPVSHTGWELKTEPWPEECCYCTDEPGAVLEFQLTSKRLWLGFRQYAGDYGRIEVQVDDWPPVPFEGYYVNFAGGDAWRGGHLIYEEIQNETRSRSHRIRIRLLDSRNPASHGNHFEIAYVLFWP